MTVGARFGGWRRLLIERTRDHRNKRVIDEEHVLIVQQHRVHCNDQGLA